MGARRSARVEQLVAEAVAEVLREGVEKRVHARLGEDTAYWFAHRVEKRLDELHGLYGKGMAVEVFGAALDSYPYIVEGVVMFRDYVNDPPRSMYHFMAVAVNGRIRVKVARMVRNAVYVHSEQL